MSTCGSPLKRRKCVPKTWADLPPDVIFSEVFTFLPTLLLVLERVGAITPWTSPNVCRAFWGYFSNDPARCIYLVWQEAAFQSYRRAAAPPLDLRVFAGIPLHRFITVLLSGNLVSTETHGGMAPSIAAQLIPKLAMVSYIELDLGSISAAVVKALIALPRLKFVCVDGNYVRQARNGLAIPMPPLMDICTVASQLRHSPYIQTIVIGMNPVGYAPARRRFCLWSRSASTVVSQTDKLTKTPVLWDIAKVMLPAKRLRLVRGVFPPQLVDLFKTVVYRHVCVSREAERYLRLRCQGKPIRRLLESFREAVADGGHWGEDGYLHTAGNRGRVSFFVTLVHE